MKNIAKFLLLFSFIFNECNAGYVESSSCVEDGCDVVCQTQTLDLLNTISDGSSTFTEFSAISDGWTYRAVIPMSCGSNFAYPASQPNQDWTTSNVWQGDNKDDYYLGLYDSSTWSYGLYDGSKALRITFTDGQSCGGSIGDRLTNFFMVCDNSYSLSSPGAEVDEYQTCRCESLKFNI